MELFFKLFERFVVAHEKQASALAQLALSQPSVKAMEAKVNAQAEPEAATEKAPTAAEKKAAAAKAKAEAEAKAKAEAEAKAKAEADAKAKAEAAKAENTQGGFEYEVLRALIGKTVQSGAEGTAIVKAMLADHGVKSAKEAPADKWEAMHDDLLSRLGGSTEPSADDAEFA